MNLIRTVNTTDNVSLSVQLPALRTSLDCKRLSQKDIIVSFFPYIKPPRIRFSLELHQTERCFGQHLHYPFVFTVPYQEQSKPFNSSSYDTRYLVDSINSTFSPTIRFSDCPSFAFIFDNVKVNITFYPL